MSKKPTTYRRDCFAFIAEENCDALTKMDCDGCSFYQRQVVREVCFADRGDECHALKIKNCDGCSFYKPASLIPKA